jgi:hypothetical protein
MWAARHTRRGSARLAPAMSLTPEPFRLRRARRAVCELGAERGRQDLPLERVKGVSAQPGPCADHRALHPETQRLAAEASNGHLPAASEARARYPRSVQQRRRKTGGSLTMLAMSRRASRVVRALALMIVLCLTLTPSAMAWRHPTKSERRAITHAAISTAAPDKKVHVSNIRVSTVGPWASAGVTINPLGLSTDILHKVHGKWILASNGTAGEWCVMPRKDQRNLGFSAGAVCGK